MKSIAIAWLFTLWITTVLSHTADRSLPEELVPAVKGALEKQLAGSDIRGREYRFMLSHHSLSGLYTFGSQATPSLPPTTLNRSNSELNGLLTEHMDDGLVGEVFY